MTTPSSRKRFGASKLSFFLPLLLGCLAVGCLQWSKPGPSERETRERARALRVIEVPVLDIRPRVTAFGTASAARNWRAVSEVKGRVKKVHPELRAGAILKEGEVLVEIDDASYQHQREQLAASVAQVVAQIAEAKQARDNSQTSLGFEKRTLQISEDELDRLEKLAAQRAGSQAEIDAQKRAVLAQQRKVDELASAIELVPVQLKTLEASRRLYEAQLAQAEIDIANTKITAPFQIRLGEVALEVGQVVAVGEQLALGAGMDLAEVTARLTVSDAGALLKPRDKPIPLGTLVVSPMDLMREIFDVEATVRLTEDATVAWPARFERVMDQVDAQTRTIGVVFGVEKPYETSIPGRRPPLIPGTFCEVEILGALREKRVIVPRHALHFDCVYVLDADDRLRRVPIEVELSQPDYLVIAAGLSGGERLVVSDPTPAIEGMLVEAKEGTATLAELRRRVLGGGNSDD